MGKYKYLANNIALFTISNFASKILVFLLVRFYTGVLTTSEYGIADVMQAALLLLVPALTMNIGEAALRFGISREENRNGIFRIGMKYVAIASGIVLIATPVAVVFLDRIYWRYLPFFVLYFTANCIYEFLILFFQGCEEARIVVIGSVSNTVILIAANVLFLLVIKIGLYGYLISLIVAFLGASLLMLCIAKKMIPYIFVKADRFVGLSQNCFDENKAPSDKTNDSKEKAPGIRELEKEMLEFSKPMILYSTGSFINNASDRFLVANMLGTAANGIYGVAYKIPSILQVFQRIFAQAWQMSATKALDENESADFYGKMYKVYNAFMVVICAGLIFLIKPISYFLFKREFFNAWIYVAPLLISVVFGALNGFIGSICLAYKDPKSMGIATGIGAVVNVVLNILTIPKYGPMGASVATLISYFLMYFIAFIKVRRHVILKINFVRDYLSYILLIAEGVIVIRGVSRVYLISGGIVALIVIMYVGEMREIVKKLLSKYVKRV